MGMAISTKAVLDTFERETPSTSTCSHRSRALRLLGHDHARAGADIGIMMSDDIVAVERASIDAIKVERLIPEGVPQA